MAVRELAHRQAIATALPGTRGVACEVEHCNTVGDLRCPSCNTQLCHKEIRTLPAGRGALCLVCDNYLSQERYDAALVLQQKLIQERLLARDAHIIAQAYRETTPSNPVTWMYALEHACLISINGAGYADTDITRPFYTNSPMVAATALADPLREELQNCRNNGYRAFFADCTARASLDTLLAILRELRHPHRLVDTDARLQRHAERLLEELVTEELADRRAIAAITIAA